MFWTVATTSRTQPSGGSQCIEQYAEAKKALYPPESDFSPDLVNAVGVG
jgi:hypothetical protein